MRSPHANLDIAIQTTHRKEREMLTELKALAKITWYLTKVAAGMVAAMALIVMAWGVSL